MNHNNINLSHRTAVYRKNQRRRRVWRRIVSVLGCIVVFVTTYALILPAVTLDDEPICGFEEHRHDSSCYLMAEPSTQLRCSAVPHRHTEECDDPCLYADFFLHSHDTDYAQQGPFVCSLPEIKAHTHDESCYTETIPLICGVEESEGHLHGDGCFTESTELTCTEPETEAHLHAEACFDENGQLVCEIPESEGHAHGEDCYTVTSTLVCETPESEGHTHSVACLGPAEKTLLCDKPEYIPHTHTDSCYTQPTEEGEEPVLCCGQIQLLEHIHSESCLVPTEVEPVLILICEKTEHIHSDGCFPPAEETTAATGETASTLTTDPTETMDPTASTEVTDPTDSTFVTDPTDVTDPTETTEVTEPVVLEVIEKVAVIYTDDTYAEISTDETVITVTGLIPADAEVRAYPVTVEADGTVLCAFDLTIFLPDGTVFEPAEGESLNVSIQAPDLSGSDYVPEVYYIPEEGEPEHIDTTVTENGVEFDAGHFSVYAVMAAETGLDSETIPYNSAGAYWHSTAYPNYQVSPMRFQKGNAAYWIETFILVSEEKYGGTTWTPDSIEWTAAGNHNYVVTYCADYEHEVSGTGGVHYIYKKLLSDTSFSADQQAALRRIITNAYPFISQEEMIQRMNAAGITGTFNPTVILWGTQEAIWKITDSQSISIYDSKVPSTDGVLNPITTTADVSEANADRVYDFLINYAVDTDPGNLAVSRTSWSENADGSYTVTIVLNRTLREGEVVTATLSNGDATVSETAEPGTDRFTIVWSAGLPETGNITLRLHGSRQAFNVYYYDDGDDYQNMIGGQYDLVELDYEEVLIRSTTNITVTKKWVETDSSTRPANLTVYLTVNGSNVVEEGISPILLNASNNWTYTWIDLPTSDNGIVLNYSVNEVTPAGYSGRFSFAESDGNKTITITNTQIPVQSQTSLTVTKQWEDGNATHSGQAVIVHLYADGVYTSRDLVLSDATGWIATFDGLPYYQDDGVTVIQYTIVEEKVEGYVPDYGDIDSGEFENVTAWVQVSSLEAGGIYQFVANGYALACDSSGNLTAVTPNQEDTYQLWHVASSGSSWTLTNAAVGKMVSFNTSFFSRGFKAADTGVALNFSDSHIYYTSGTIVSTNYYMTLSSGSVGHTTSSSSASTLTVYRKTTYEQVPPYNITLTNQLAPSYELPETGGMGTQFFTFGGIAMIAAALMWGCTQRRKRERRAA